MRIIKPMRLGLLTKTHPNQGAGAFIVTSLTMFDLLDPTDLLAETAIWPLAAQELPAGAILDECMPKPTGELLIAGKAMAPHGTPVRAMRAGVQVGSLARTFSVFGNRYWHRGVGRPEFDDPETFVEMPLTPEFAFGGEGHPTNPKGRGYNAEDLLDGGYHPPLPNVEIHGHEIISIRDRTAPAIVGPIPPDDPARVKLAGTYDQHWIDHRMPEFPDDFDQRYFLQAPEEQRLPDYFTGFEDIRVLGMSARHPDVVSRMPGIRVRMFVERHSDAGALHELRVRTDTVWIFGSQMKGLVINRGVIGIADANGLDVKGVMLGCEFRRNEVKPAQHYQDVYRLRSDPVEGPKYALADHQLMPRIDAGELDRREAVRRAEALARREQSERSRQWMLARQMADAGLPAQLVPAQEPPETKPLILPSSEDIARGDVDFARLISDAEDMRREADVKMSLIALQAQSIAETAGSKTAAAPPLSGDALAEAAREIGVGPGYLPGIENMLNIADINSTIEDLRDTNRSLPAPLAADDDLAAIGDLLAIVAAEGDDGAPSDPESAEQAFQQARARALCLPEGSLLFEAKSQLADFDLGSLEDDDTARAASAGGVPDGFAGAADDLGAVVGASLPQLEIAEGESALAAIQNILGDLAGDPSISPADRVADARKQIDDADRAVAEAMAEARRMSPQPSYPLEPLGDEVARRLGQFVLEEWRSGHRFIGADLAGVDLAGADVSTADFTGSFFETARLSSARFAGTLCEKAVFTAADLTDADFSRALLTGANLSAVKAARSTFAGVTAEALTVLDGDFSGADFSGARLTRCRFVRCDFTGARFDGAVLDHCSFVEGRADGLSANELDGQTVMVVNFSCDRSHWRGARLVKGIFAGCSFEGADFSGGHLTQSGFFGETNMTGAQFIETVAEGCGFHAARLTQASFLRAKLDKSSFMMADLSNADLRLASLKGAIMTFAAIRASDLFGANLNGAVLQGADLSGSSLVSANLYQAALGDVRLAAADLSHANVRLTNMEAKVS